VLKIRDDKEIAFDAILQLKLPYTIIDVGFWYQISYPRVPSGKLDYSLVPVAPAPNEYIGDGSTKNLLTDVRDVGEFVARIVKDPRTVNKRVVAWSDELSQKEIFDIVERYTGEVVERKYLSVEQVHEAVAEVREKYKLASDEGKARIEMQLYVKEYWLSKYVKEYNSREMALYVGYLDARELYPDFKPRSFEETFKEVVDGNAVKLYAGRF
jgi:nucleoside-diphosphate-sugar epimerase